jgi:hypothetical protein
MQDVWQVVFHGQGPIMSVNRLLGHFYSLILPPNHQIVKFFCKIATNLVTNRELCNEPTCFIKTSEFLKCISHY